MKKLIVPIVAFALFSIWSCEEGTTSEGDATDSIDSVVVADPSEWKVKSITEQTMGYVVDEVVDTSLIEITEFDSLGRKISFCRIPTEGEKHTSRYSYEGDSLMKIVTTFEDSTEFVERHMTDSTGRRTDVYWEDEKIPAERFQYNESGQLVEKDEMEESTNNVVMKIMYSYNEKGQLVTEEESYAADAVVYKSKTYEYDENGDVTKEKCWSDEDPSDNYVIMYEYPKRDETGRWTECVRIETNETTDYSYKSLITRKIEYYKDDKK